MPGHKVARSAVKDTNAFDKYQCSHCRLFLKNAVQPVCGHLLCESCAVSLRASATPKCPRPDCQEDLKSDLEDDTADLVDKHQQYTCPVCSRLLRDAVQTNCAHMLCENCAEEIFYEAFLKNKDATCPKDGCGEKLRGEDGTKYFPDRRLRKEIQSLPVTCSINGCPWKGCLEDYENHLCQQHPCKTVQPVQKRKATHALVDINGIQTQSTTSLTLRETAQQMKHTAESLLKEADSLDSTTEGAEYVKRVSAAAGSMPRLHSVSGGALSNSSLQRAHHPEQFPEDKSSTLDAQRSSQVHLETFPGIEQTVQQQPRTEMVTGTPTIKTCTDISFQPQASLELPLLSPSVMEQRSPQHPQMFFPPPSSPVHVTAAQSVSPHRRQRRHSPQAAAAVDRLPPLTLAPPTVSPPRLISQSQGLSPRQDLTDKQLDLPPVSPRRKPIKSKKSKTMPLVSSECTDCKEKDRKLAVVTNMYCQAMKDGLLVQKCNCSKGNLKQGRGRLMTL